MLKWLCHPGLTVSIKTELRPIVKVGGNVVPQLKNKNFLYSPSLRLQGPLKLCNGCILLYVTHGQCDAKAEITDKRIM